MALSPSSPSPSASSSAVTLPRPGKSILKKPPPPQQSFFSLSRLSRLLPNQPSASTSSSAGATSGPRDANSGAASTSKQAGDATKSDQKDRDAQTLKRAHFFLPALATVYPISSSLPPSTSSTQQEKCIVETREAERRRRVVRGNSIGSAVVDGNGGGGNRIVEDWWTLEKVAGFYKECCAGREEVPHLGIEAALRKASGANGRVLDLSGVQITLPQAAVLSDVFSVEWGLRKLFLKECDLDEHNLKPILHSLLIPNSLNFLSVASNRRLKAPAFKILGSFVSKSRNLQFLDLSMNAMDKKSVESLASCLRPASPSGDGKAISETGTGLVSLRMDDCSLRPASLEILAQNVRTSSLRNISLRHNRISASSAVALALMIKDYPDTMPSSYAPSNGSTSALSTASNSPNSSSASLFNTLSPPLTPTAETPPFTPTIASGQHSHLAPAQLQTVHSNASPRPSSLAVPPSPLSSIASPQRSVQTLPPPVHPANAPLPTTYTPYIPKARRLAAMNASANPGSSVGIGATANARALQNASRAPDPPNVPVITSSSGGGVVVRHAANGVTSGVPAKKGSGGPSAALLDKVRALDALPRLGELRTLDLRGNDIRNGITYIAQVLKRNRTLKVLNLSENKIDVHGLVAVAEALKYNLTLETLDLSKNACSGPLLDGIQSLRTAFTLNTSLKRLFLTGTSLNSAGAIALAEFLPESTSLLHLDLTNNNLELAGVMALSEGLKANHVMRCLDLNIPPDDEEFARMCRDILNTCVRNTEEAEKSAKTLRGTASAGKAVWGMIEESELAKTFKRGERGKVDEDLLVQAKSCLSELEALLARIIASKQEKTPSQAEDDATITGRVEGKQNEDAEAEELIERAKAALVVIGDVIQGIEDPIRMEELFYINDSITGVLTQIDQERSSLPPKSTSRTSTPTPGSESVIPRAAPRAPFQQKADAMLNPNGNGNGGLGLRLVIPSSASITTAELEGDFDMGLETPRIDKGKGRAAPEPEVHEPVTSPNIILKGSDEEDGTGDEGEVGEEEEQNGDAAVVNGLSRVMVAEEGEIFRKGHALLTPKELEGEYDGEELRIELLEAKVERPPPRSLNFDDFNIDELPPLPASPSTPLLSPSPNPLDSPSHSPGNHPNLRRKPSADGLLSPPPLSPSLGSATKQLPKPYIRRSHSASSASASPLGMSPSLTELSLKSPGGSVSIDAPYETSGTATSLSMQRSTSDAH